jgi:methionyl-tRNA formyltransferase
MKPLRWLYVSRQNNRSGYYVLKHLLEEGLYFPVAVLLPKTSNLSCLKTMEELTVERKKYQDEISISGCSPLRFFESIHLLCNDYGIEITELNSIKDGFAYRWLQSLNLDLIVLGGGWPQLIPASVIQLPGLGVLNTHPSLLPEFRGTDVHRWQIYSGVKTSGTTIHYVDENFDTGPILGQIPVEISPRDTPQQLAEKTGIAAGPLMSTVISKIIKSAPDKVSGVIQPTREDRSKYFSRWLWDDRDFMRIRWSNSAEEIFRFCLACTQESYRYNGPYFEVRGKEYILREAEVVMYTGNGRSGEVVKLENYPVISCGTPGSALLLKQIQPIDPSAWGTASFSQPAMHGGLAFSQLSVQNGEKLYNKDV